MGYEQEEQSEKFIEDEEKTSEPITLPQSKEDKKSSAKSIVVKTDPFKLRVRLHNMQEKELISKDYNFLDMSDEEIYVVDDEIARDSKISSRVARAKVGMIVTWTVIDVLLKLMGMEYVSYADLQMKNMKIYTKSLYQHYSEQVDKEDAETVVDVQEPLDRIMDMSIKIAVVAILLNVVANKMGGTIATMAKPLAMKMVSCLDEVPGEDPAEVLSKSKGMLDVVTDVRKMMSDGVSTNTVEHAIEVIEDDAPPFVV